MKQSKLNNKYDGILSSIYKIVKFYPGLSGVQYANIITTVKVEYSRSYLIWWTDSSSYDFVTSVNPKTIKNFSLNVTQRYQNFNEQIILKLYDGYLTSIPRSSLNASQDYQD